MKSKNLRLILIVLTIVIWGIIILRIISYLQKPKIKTSSEQQISFEKNKFEIKDTFQIVANYKDPFLSKAKTNGSYQNTRSDNSNPGKSSATENTNLKETKKDIIWPGISYNGVIFNPKNQKQTGILSINNKNMLVMKGNTYEGIFVEMIFQDSIRVIYQKEIKTITKKK